MTLINLLFIFYILNSFFNIWFYEQLLKEKDLELKSFVCFLSLFGTFVIYMFWAFDEEDLLDDSD